MNIKNEYVKIIGSKEYTFRNYIYDNYLEYIKISQYDVRAVMPRFYSCALKFDDPFDDILNKEVSDFDIIFTSTAYFENSTKNKVEVKNNYTPNWGIIDNVFDAKTWEHIDDLSDYYGKKITAIGFTYTDTIDDYEEKIGSCLNASNYSIYFEENMIFQRKDTITTDMIPTNDYPEHIIPDFGKAIKIDDEWYFCYVNLYSIGFGSELGVMDEEYVIGEDINLINIDNTSFGFSLNNTYSQRHKEIYPQTKLYSGNSKMPLLPNRKYIIYKYRYYYYDYHNDDYYFINEYYTTNLLNDTKGEFEIITRFERSE